MNPVAAELLSTNPIGWDSEDKVFQYLQPTSGRGMGLAQAWHGRGMGGVGVKSFVQEVLTDCADLCPFLCEQL